MRFGVLGARGQLGSDLCPRLRGEVIPLSRADIDLTKPDLIPEALGALRLDVLINCAAYNFVDRAETEPEAAFAVNTWGVRALARACQARSIRLVHFSTDYVFGLDRDRVTPLTEDDPPGPVNLYGLSKLAGEYLAFAECPTTLIIRSCGLYGVGGSGGKGRNFVETILRLAREGKPIRVVNDQRCTPTYTVDLAETTISLLEGGAEGLYHVTNAGSCTWHEFAREVFRISELKADLKSISSEDFGALAKRPSFSVLNVQKAAVLGHKPMRLWTEAVAEYLVAYQARCH